MDITTQVLEMQFLTQSLQNTASNLYMYKVANYLK